jgi:Do/DeqQ family serine protease
MNYKKILGTFLIACLGGGVALGVFSLVDNDAPKTIQEKQDAVTFAKVKHEVGDVPTFNFTTPSKAATPAVVHIQTTVQATSSNGSGLDFFEFFGEGFEMPQRQPQGGSGSGVIITNDGYIATNNHVIDGATSIEVVLQDKRKFNAELIGRDPSTDLALLKIETKDLPFLKFGNSDNVEVGEWVLAVGNPFNLTSTVTAGIVSAKGRNINLLRDRNNQYAIENFIQTDAAVNPGNSGGALVNMNGELIGINTAIATRTGSYSGYSFAVPVNIVKKVMDDILKYGEVQRGFLGVEIRDVTAELAEEKNIDDIKGVYVNKVNEGSAAAAAGMKDGDIITKVNDVVVNSSSALQEQVSRYHPGDKVNITIKRKGTEKVLTPILKNREGTTELVKRSEKKSSTALVKGIELQKITAKDKSKYKVKNGVKITDVKSGAFKNARVPKGFIITHIDKKPIYTLTEAKRILNAKSGGILVEGVEPDGTEGVYGLKLD